MNSQDVAVAVGEWALEVNEELTTAYAYSPLQKDNELPDVVVEIDASGIRLGDSEFPFRDIQQRAIRRWDITASFMVVNDDPAEAASLLRTFADRCTTELMSDSTLRGRVPFVSPFVTFDYTPPFVEYADGTRGREMTFALSVGELIEVDQ